MPQVLQLRCALDMLYFGEALTMPKSNDDIVYVDEKSYQAVNVIYDGLFWPIY
jgi:hypothetical protein